MAQLTGTISDGDQIIMQDVPMSIQENPATSHTWGFQGVFILPPGSKWLKPGERYHLRLSDGRSGDILIKSTPTGTREATQVHFVNAGRFTEAGDLP
jgi:hypothetical protein